MLIFQCAAVDDDNYMLSTFKLPPLYYSPLLVQVDGRPKPNHLFLLLQWPNGFDHRHSSSSSSKVVVGWKFGQQTLPQPSTDRSKNLITSICPFLDYCKGRGKKYRRRWWFLVRVVIIIIIETVRMRALKSPKMKTWWKSTHLLLPSLLSAWLNLTSKLRSIHSKSF